MAEKSELGDETPNSLESLLQRAPSSQVGFRSTLAVGNKLAAGRFEICGRIGEGGMGVVYEAFDAERRTRVALKTLSRLEASGIYRLKSEFRALADVSHPNLVRLHELFANDGQWFFTMDLVPGLRFDEWVRPGGVLDEVRLRAAFPQLRRAVLAIHDAGKLHRDLKPSNVLVTPGGRVVVLDFGLASDPELGGVGQTLADDSFSGTPAYMAPEHAGGEQATAASDFYALGVMLFEALTGRLPFGGRPHEMFANKQRRDAPSAASLCAGVAADLDAICRDLLRREPGVRLDGAALGARLGDVGPSTGDARAAAVSPESEPMVGREAELVQLRAAYESTVGGQAVLVFVSGESGMGKSALVDAFLSEVREQGHAAVLAGRCFERESLPFKGFDSLVDELSRFLRLLPPAGAAGLLPREVFALARLFPVLDRVDAVASAPKRDVPDAQELRRRAFLAFGELIARIRDRRPLVLYIDDAQWLDRDSVAFLRALLVHGEPVPALAILTHRSEGADRNPLLQSVFEAAQSNSMLDVRSMRVGPLAVDAAEQLAGRWFRGEDRSLAESVAREARGSPFFVAALARHAVRSEARGCLPAVSLATALADHLAELSAESRRVLEVIALAGSPLPMQVVIDAAISTRADLDVLQRTRLVRTSGGELLETVECYHDRIREAVGGSLSEEACRGRYAGLARVLEAHPDLDTELLARCFEGSGQMALAAVHAERAGDKAVAATAFEHAASLFRRALAVGQHAGAVRHALSLKLGDALAEAGKGPEAAEVYRRCAGETTGAESIDLRRKAAEQLVTCGQMSEGEALLRDVCREVGVRIAATPGHALLSLVLSQARVRMTKLDIERPTRGSVPAAMRLRLECQFSAMKSLTAHAPIVAASIGDHWLLDALRAREPDHIARALTAQLYNYSISSSVDERRLAQLVQAAERATADPGVPEVRGLMLLSIGSADNNLGRWTAARPAFARALEVFRGKCRGTAWETDALLFQDQLAAFQRGDFSDVARTGPTAIEESFRRGRLLAGALLSGCFGLPARLVHDDVRGARMQLEEALSRWVPQAEMLAADYMLWVGRALLELYQDDPVAACARLDARVSAYRRTMLTHVGWLRVHFLAARGGSALAVLRTRHGARAHRDLARRCAQKLAGERLPYAPSHALALEAGLALAYGNGEQAISHVRRSMAGFDGSGMHAYAAALRRRLGQLIGGDEGAAHVEASAAFFREQGTKNPEAMTDMLAPGLRVQSTSAGASGEIDP